jgi:lactate dehydrogenase-like 2-hydroxyacid dehydrogenase
MPDTVIAALGSRFELTVREQNTALGAPELRDLMQAYDALLPTLGDRFTADAFVAGARCRLLANFGVGYSHIDVDAAAAAGVVVSNTPGAVTDATADIATMLMLMACRRASEGEKLVRDGQWDGWHPTQLLGQHVSGKTLGVIGMGRIGKAVARRAHFGFGMSVVFYNRSKVADPTVPGARQLDSIIDVLKTADVVQLCVPGGDQTRHLIAAAELSAMAPHAVIVNTARGEVIDEQALIEALTARQIHAAGLDVYEHEPAVPQALRQLTNVTLLPHLGTSSLEVRESMGLMAVENLIAFFNDEAVPNRVN